MDKIPTKIENPTGLHQRYKIQKITGYKTENVKDKYGERTDVDKHTVILKPVDEGAEYFVLRLDIGGSDIEHIKACRIGVNAYADAIQHHLPDLAHDLRERYPLI